MTLTRIPLDVIATGSGQRTEGVLVAVMASDLEQLEARLAAAESVLAGKPWSRRLLERAYGERENT